MYLEVLVKLRPPGFLDAVARPQHLLRHRRAREHHGVGCLRFCGVLDLRAKRVPGSRKGVPRLRECRLLNIFGRKGVNVTEDVCNVLWEQSRDEEKHLFPRCLVDWELPGRVSIYCDGGKTMYSVCSPLVL